MLFDFDSCKGKLDCMCRWFENVKIGFEVKYDWVILVMKILRVEG